MSDRFFDEIEIGHRWVTKARTITETDVVNFAGVSGDWHSIHTDREYAANTSFGERIAHGFLVLSVASGMVPVKRDAVLALYGLDRIRFTAPVFIGDTIHLEMEAVDKVERDDGTGVVTYDFQVVNQDDKPVIVCMYKLWIRERPAHDA